MTVEAPPEGDPAVPQEEERASERRAVERRLAAAALALLPAALVIFFSFNGGGYFAGSVGFAALLVSQTIVLRVLVADEPFAGFSRPLAGVLLVMSLYAAWTLASGLWSHAEDRALIEFDRALFYVLVLLLMGLLPRRMGRVRWIVRGTAAAAFAVSAAALITRVLPHVWPTSPGVSNDRLSFPLTYWNALGLLAAIGLILMVGLTTNDREGRLSRTLAAAAVPVLATTLFFTFSRGAIAVVAVALVVYLLLARQRAIPGGFLAVVPPTVVALVTAYGADQLATLDPTTPRGVAQGKDLALAVALCVLAAGGLRFLLAPLDRRLAAVQISSNRRRRIRIGTGALAVAAVAIALAAGGGSWLSDQYHGFIRGGATAQNDLRLRLTDPSSNGRTEHWRAALQGFADQPLRGSGAGTYQFTWEKKRRLQVTVVDAHGLYFEVMSELGIVGLVLILVAILSVLVTFARRAQGPNRAYYAALFAAGLAWAVHAGVDWDWEMPAVTAWFFAAGGAALAARDSAKARASATPLANGSRITIAAAFLVLAATPALLMLSQSRISDAAGAFQRADCRAASRSALASLDYMAIRPEPYQMLGYCDLDQGRLTQAVAAMSKAVEQEPRNWEYHYSLAIAQAEAGRDPLGEIETAARLNPRESLVTATLASFRKATPATRQQAGEQARREALSSGRLTLK